jgi:hypothetical protein
MKPRGFARLIDRGGSPDFSSKLGQSSKDFRLPKGLGVKHWYTSDPNLFGA